MGKAATGAVDTRGVTCRRLTIVALAISAFAPAASAQADVVLNPSATFALGSQPMQAAQAIARQHWGVDPCGGQVAISWVSLAPTINATSTWTNPKSSYDNPDLNGDCRIEFNTGMDFDWEKFCTVVVHEYGHLSGKPHSPDVHDVMAAFYSDPLAECIPPASQAPAQASGQPPAAASTTPARAAVVTLRPAARKHVVKRGKLHRESKPHKKHKKQKRHRAHRH